MLGTIYFLSLWVVAAGWLSRPIAQKVAPLVIAGSVFISSTPVASNAVLAVDATPAIVSVDASRNRVKLPSGLEYFDVKVGEGKDEVKEGNSVQFQWVLRRSNGYYVDSSGTEPGNEFIYKVGNLKKVIRGIDEGIRGMKVGGVRRLAIPPQLAWTEGLDSSNPGPIPSDFGPRRQIITRLDKETWYFEIKVIKIK